LQSTAESVRLSVKDDGQGFGREENGGTSPGHYGLIRMKERAAQIGADLKLVSKPGNGTTISVAVPAGRGVPVADAEVVP